MYLDEDDGMEGKPETSSDSCPIAGDARNTGASDPALALSDQSSPRTPCSHLLTGTQVHKCTYHTYMDVHMDGW